MQPSDCQQRRKRSCEFAQKKIVFRIRKKGGGRKSYQEHHREIDKKFLLVLKNHTAGSPMDAKVRWTNLTTSEIVMALQADYAIWISRHVVRKLLKKHDYRFRKAQKRCTMKEVANRDAQFKNIARQIEAYQAAGQPIMSMDSKKKEHIGNFYRAGQLFTREELKTWDHDFVSFAEGIIIPHGLYDIVQNIGYIHIGTSHDTSEFACDSIGYWWDNFGKHDYPDATALLILCDGGGSNSSRHFIFKEDLQALADEIGIEIRIAHYPAYCSKWNPIEHRFFPHVTRACQGVVFTSVELVKELMEKTHTKTGLKTFVHVIDKAYETGRKYATDFKENMRIVFDGFLPNWNYCAVPAQTSNG